MPLQHKATEKAFEHNIKKELEAGKPKDQALAIAYSIKREAAKNSENQGPEIKNPAQGKIRGDK